MYIFYDFETSSKEFIGQILSYAFIVTDQQFNIKDELVGTIKLNRTQLPDVGAILTNKIDIDDLEKEGYPEHIAAEKIFHFLNKQIEKYRTCKLVGYNSNAFDLQFLRNLLIRYGINPYFKGKFSNVDILHFMKHLAFENADSFKWVLKESENEKGGIYYTFKLEELSKAFGVLHEAQTHSAYEDVKLLIDLVKTCEKEFNFSLSEFMPFQVPESDLFQGPMEIAKQKITVYGHEGPEPPEKFAYKYWLKMFSGKKDYILLDLEAYDEKKKQDHSNQDILSCVRYINSNKHFFILEPLTETERQYFEPIVHIAARDDFLKTLSYENYFDYIKKDWDIEYQIHLLGFERIDELHKLVTKLLEDSSRYEGILQNLLKKRTNQKDNYLIQLFNRVYLNFHPNPRHDYMKRYMAPRYIAGDMLRNPEEFVCLEDRVKKIEEILRSDDYDEGTKKAIQSLKNLYAKHSLLVSA